MTALPRNSRPIETQSTPKQRAPFRRLAGFLVLLLVALSLSPAGLRAQENSAAPATGLRFEVQLSPKIRTEPVAGRLYVFLSTKAAEPRFGPDWYAPEPFFGGDVANIRPGQMMVVDDRADGFPGPLSELPPGRYRIQALLDHDPDSQHHAYGDGNFYSRVVEAELHGGNQMVRLLLDQLTRPRPFPQVPGAQEIALRSRLLSDFHKREVVERCGVVLPDNYAREPQRRYPVIYQIPGFGGTHHPSGRPPRPGPGETEFIRVYLSGQTKWGHHVYADSDTNGPRGQALIAELIPYIDANFRTVAAPHGRLVTGHSSGGWSSLWLQVNYPEIFGGVWSTAPDPVDFRDFQQVDLYAQPPLSLYFDENGAPRPIARRNGRPVLWYESFGRMDDALGRGGQLRSFEAAFSTVDDEGQPHRLWDRETGRIDPEIARSWEHYDIRLRLESDWERLEPLLRGKLHVFMGDLDTYYLEGAVVRLRDSLRALGSDARIEIVRGADHSSLLTPALAQRIRQEMTARFLAGQRQ